MKNIWFGFAVFLGAVCSFSNARIRIGVCEDKYSYFTCTCGQDYDDVEVRVKVKQCKYTHFFIYNTCEPCEELTSDEICSRYESCKKCYKNGGDSCEACPDNKYGKWCKRTCYCQNGGTCDSKGKCICPPSFEGRNCQEKRGCLPPFTLSPTLKFELQPPDSPKWVVYRCPPEYVLVGKSVSRCVSGNWASEPPDCRRKCPLLFTPDNSRLELSGKDLVVGITAEIKCNQGYHMIGQKTLMCMENGQWNGILPFCEEFETCLDPGNVQYAEKTVLPGGVNIRNHFMPDSKIQYKCQEGFEQIGVKTIFCRLNGTWSNSLPSCIKATCRDPGPIVNGKANPIGRIDNVFYVGASIEYSCQDQYYLIGEKSIFCTSNGTWSAKKPECIKVDACGNPPIPAAGSVKYSLPLKAISAQISRSRETRSRPNSRIPLLPPGRTIPKPRSVQISSTPASETIPLPPDLHRVGTTATYDCESKYYELIGSKSRRCQENGEWSGRPPMCMPICGQSNSPRIPFIVYGYATEEGQWPWQAEISVYDANSNMWVSLCGASLLNEEWVITAAHCVTYNGTKIIVEPEKFQVYMGKYYITDSEDEEHVQVRKVREIHIPPEYDQILVDADIALIRLDSPVHLNERVQPICLPTEETTRKNLVEGNKGVVTGWGIDENGKHPEKLQQTVLPFVSKANCEKGYEDADLPLTVTDNMFCAGYAEGGSATCMGDSGNPMIFIDSTSQERRWILEGIVSWGGLSKCGSPNEYSGFTKVSRYLDWIHHYI